MTDLLEMIRTRRSIRRFEAQEISPETLNQLFEAVKWSPSWANTQCWEIVVVQDPAVRAGLQACLYPKNPATRAVVDAPVLLALCARKEVAGFYDGGPVTKFGDWFMFDLGLATQSLCLTAHALGLGTVIVGLFDHDRAANLLHVPPTHELVTLIPLGHPAKAPSPPSRKEVCAFVHHEAF